MENKMDIRIKKTYKSLFGAFIDLLSEKNFSELTVSEICNKAKVHRATFYKHFEDKYAFLNFIFEKSLSEIKLNGLETDHTPQNIKENFMYFIKIIFEYIQKNKLVFKVIFSEKHSLSISSTFVSAVETYIISNIKMVLSDVPDESLEVFASFYANAFIGVVKWYSTNDTEYPPEFLYEFLERRVDELCGYYEKNMYS